MAGQQYIYLKKRQSNVSALGFGVTTITLAKTRHLAVFEKTEVHVLVKL